MKKKVQILILYLCVLGVAGYTLSLTLRLKQSEHLLVDNLNQNLTNQEKIQQLTQTAESLNADLFQIIDKNNELRTLLGAEQIRVSRNPVVDKEIKEVMKKIYVTCITSANFEVGQVLFDDKIVLEFANNKTDSGMALQRAQEICQRIRLLLYDRSLYEKIVIKNTESGTYGIYIKDKLVFSVGPEESKYKSMEALELAQLMAKTMHKELLEFNKVYLLSYLKNKYNKDLDKRYTNLTSIMSSADHNTSQFEAIVKRHYKRYQATPSISPINTEICSGFGFRKSPFSRRTKFHSGIDLLANVGTPVKATADGCIGYRGWYIGYGYALQVNHGYGIQTIYGHLSRIMVRQGQLVKKGQIVAYSGNSGLSTGPHLHYEIRAYNRPVDPTAYLNLDILFASRVW